MNALIAFSLKHRVLMLTLCVIVLVGGLLAFRQLNIEAYPDPTPPMVDVITQSPGLSAEEIERYITIPIETQTAAIKNLRVVRTISLYGLSDVKLQFTFDYTYEEALQQVLNRLASLPTLLNNAQPQISPGSPIGDVGNTMLNQRGGNPVLVKDVATVTVGNQPRLGIAGRDDEDDIVQGIVLMRRGEQSMPTIERVHAEIDRINSTGILPPGVQIERIYDRKDLIDVTTRTVLHNMAFGIPLIFLLQWVFLGNFRSAVIVGATIPFALFFAIGIMVMRGESANLLSVGAIDFGLIVDATVLMVESIFRQLGDPHGHAEPVAGETASYTLSGELLDILYAAA